MKFYLNKKQRDYLDQLVEDNPDRLILYKKLYDSNKVEEDLSKLGYQWETMWMDADRYVNDKLLEIRINYD